MHSTNIAPDGSIHFAGFRLEASWPSLTDLAAEFWRYTRLSDREKDQDDEMQAYCCVSDLVDEFPWPRALELISELINLAEDDDEICYIAAGPLEDLVRASQALQLVSQIEVRARRDPRFRRAVAGVWLDRSTHEEVNKRLALFGARFPDGSKPG